jgi:hypothetical protein
MAGIFHGKLVAITVSPICRYYDSACMSKTSEMKPGLVRYKKP